MRIRSLNHSTYQLQYHVVWGTKYRYKYLKPYVKHELLASFYATVKKYPTLHLESVNTDEDHVHLQLEVAPSIALSDAVKVLKQESSKHLRQTFKFIRDMYLEKDGIWSVGYFVSSIGLNEDQIKRYITHQGNKERPQTARLFYLPPSKRPGSS